MCGWLRWPVGWYLGPFSGCAGCPQGERRGTLVHGARRSASFRRAKCLWPPTPASQAALTQERPQHTRGGYQFRATMAAMHMRMPGAAVGSACQSCGLRLGNKGGWVPEWDCFMPAAQHRHPLGNLSRQRTSPPTNLVISMLAIVDMTVRNSVRDSSPSPHAWRGYQPCFPPTPFVAPLNPSTPHGQCSAVFNTSHRGIVSVLVPAPEVCNIPKWPIRSLPAARLSRLACNCTTTVALQTTQTVSEGDRPNPTHLPPLPRPRAHGPGKGLATVRHNRPGGAVHAPRAPRVR